MKDEKYYFHQTPESLCKDIIQRIIFKEDDIILEPFSGEGNFYYNLPQNIEKYKCEIEEGMCFKNFDYENIKPTMVISNPPFLLDGKNAFFEIVNFYSKIKSLKRLIFLCNDNCVGSLTPIRMQKINNNNLFLNKKTTVNVKKWRGRYYILEFLREKNESFDYLINNYE